jgi:hypothetical protein
VSNINSVIRDRIVVDLLLLLVAHSINGIVVVIIMTVLVILFLLFLALLLLLLLGLHDLFLQLHQLIVLDVLVFRADGDHIVKVLFIDKVLQVLVNEVVLLRLFDQRPPLLTHLPYSSEHRYPWYEQIHSIVIIFNHGEAFLLVLA